MSASSYICKYIILNAQEKVLKVLTTVWCLVVSSLYNIHMLVVVHSIFKVKIPQGLSARQIFNFYSAVAFWIRMENFVNSDSDPDPTLIVGLSGRRRKLYT